MTVEGHNGCFPITQMPLNELRHGHLPQVLVGKQNGKAHQFVMSTKANSIHNTLKYYKLRSSAKIRHGSPLNP